MWFKINNRQQSNLNYSLVYRTRSINPYCGLYTSPCHWEPCRPAPYRHSIYVDYIMQFFGFVKRRCALRNPSNAPKSRGEEIVFTISDLCSYRSQSTNSFEISTITSIHTRTFCNSLICYLKIAFVWTSNKWVCNFLFIRHGGPFIENNEKLLWNLNDDQLLFNNL